MKIFNKTINGYWREMDVSYMPQKSGVYFVYRGKYDAASDRVSIRELLYVGKAENINERLLNHEKYGLWKRYLWNGEELLFSCTEEGTTANARLEAAYIYEHQPICNTQGKDSFNYPLTRVISSGSTAQLQLDFSVQQAFIVGTTSLSVMLFFSYAISKPVIVIIEAYMIQFDLALIYNEF